MVEYLVWRVGVEQIYHPLAFRGFVGLGFLLFGAGVDSAGGLEGFK